MFSKKALASLDLDSDEDSDEMLVSYLQESKGVMTKNRRNLLEKIMSDGSSSEEEGGLRSAASFEGYTDAEDLFSVDTGVNKDLMAQMIDPVVVTKPEEPVDSEIAETNARVVTVENEETPKIEGEATPPLDTQDTQDKKRSNSIQEVKSVRVEVIKPPSAPRRNRQSIAHEAHAHQTPIIPLVPSQVAASPPKDTAKEKMMKQINDKRLAAALEARNQPLSTAAGLHHLIDTERVLERKELVSDNRPKNNAQKYRLPYKSNGTNDLRLRKLKREVHSAFFKCDKHNKGYLSASEFSRFCFLTGLLDSRSSETWCADQDENLSTPQGSMVGKCFELVRGIRTGESASTHAGTTLCVTLPQVSLFADLVLNCVDPDTMKISDNINLTEGEANALLEDLQSRKLMGGYGKFDHHDRKAKELKREKEQEKAQHPHAPNHLVVPACKREEYEKSFNPSKGRAYFTQRHADLKAQIQQKKELECPFKPIMASKSTREAIKPVQNLDESIVTAPHEVPGSGWYQNHLRGTFHIPSKVTLNSHLLSDETAIRNRRLEKQQNHKEYEFDFSMNNSKRVRPRANTMTTGIDPFAIVAAFTTTDMDNTNAIHTSPIRSPKPATTVPMNSSSASHTMHTPLKLSSYELDGGSSPASSSSNSIATGSVQVKPAMLDKMEADGTYASSLVSTRDENEPSEGESVLIDLDSLHHRQQQQLLSSPVRAVSLRDKASLAQQISANSKSSRSPAKKSPTKIPGQKSKANKGGSAKEDYAAGDKHGIVAGCGVYTVEKGWRQNAVPRPGDIIYYFDPVYPPDFNSGVYSLEVDSAPSPSYAGLVASASTQQPISSAPGSVASAGEAIPVAPKILWDQPKSPKKKRDDFFPIAKASAGKTVRHLLPSTGPKNSNGAGWGAIIDEMKARKMKMKKRRRGDPGANTTAKNTSGSPDSLGTATNISTYTPTRPMVVGKMHNLYKKKYFHRRGGYDFGAVIDELQHKLRKLRALYKKQGGKADLGLEGYESPPPSLSPSAAAPATAPPALKPEPRLEETTDEQLMAKADLNFMSDSESGEDEEEKAKDDREADPTAVKVPVAVPVAVPLSPPPPPPVEGKVELKSEILSTPVSAVQTPGNVPAAPPLPETWPPRANNTNTAEDSAKSAVSCGSSNGDNDSGNRGKFSKLNRYFGLDTQPSTAAATAATTAPVTIVPQVAKETTHSKLEMQLSDGYYMPVPPSMRHRVTAHTVLGLGTVSIQMAQNLKLAANSARVQVSRSNSVSECKLFRTPTKAGKAKSPVKKKKTVNPMNVSSPGKQSKNIKAKVVMGPSTSSVDTGGNRRRGVPPEIKYLKGAKQMRRLEEARLERESRTKATSLRCYEKAFAPTAAAVATSTTSASAAALATRGGGASKLQAAKKSSPKMVKKVTVPEPFHLHLNKKYAEKAKLKQTRTSPPRRSPNMQLPLTTLIDMDRDTGLDMNLARAMEMDGHCRNVIRTHPPSPQALAVGNEHTLRATQLPKSLGIDVASLGMDVGGGRSSPQALGNGLENRLFLSTLRADERDRKPHSHSDLKDVHYKPLAQGTLVTDKSKQARLAREDRKRQEESDKEEQWAREKEALHQKALKAAKERGVLRRRTRVIQPPPLEQKPDAKQVQRITNRLYYGTEDPMAPVPPPPTVVLPSAQKPGEEGTRKEVRKAEQKYDEKEVEEENLEQEEGPIFDKEALDVQFDVLNQQLIKLSENYPMVLKGVPPIPSKPLPERRTIFDQTESGDTYDPYYHQQAVAEATATVSKAMIGLFQESFGNGHDDRGDDSSSGKSSMLPPPPLSLPKDVREKGIKIDLREYDELSPLPKDSTPRYNF